MVHHRSAEGRALVDVRKRHTQEVVELPAHSDAFIAARRRKSKGFGRLEGRPCAHFNCALRRLIEHRERTRDGEGIIGLRLVRLAACRDKGVGVARRIEEIENAHAEVDEVRRGSRTFTHERHEGFYGAGEFFKGGLELSDAGREILCLAHRIEGFDHFVLGSREGGELVLIGFCGEMSRVGVEAVNELLLEELKSVLVDQRFRGKRELS